MVRSSRGSVSETRTGRGVSLLTCDVVDPFSSELADLLTVDGPSDRPPCALPMWLIRIDESGSLKMQEVGMRTRARRSDVVGKFGRGERPMASEPAKQLSAGTIPDDLNGVCHPPGHLGGLSETRHDANRA
jgi:hypothetical protein